MKLVDRVIYVLIALPAMLIVQVSNAQYARDTTDSAWLAAMIFGGFLFLAAIGVVVAAAIYLLGARRPGRRLPRGA